ncbi:hypothetical protein, partial [Mediterraneibacter faecis]|uniref:hypothetical protein n=1 Tax=Mediterraneibacter faecis TaxID=592978 RepID=UPI001EDDABD3
MFANSTPSSPYGIEILPVPLDVDNLAFVILLLLFYSFIVNPHQNLRHIFSIFHLSECVIERITLSHIQGCISRRFHFDEL